VIAFAGRLRHDAKHAPQIRMDLMDLAHRLVIVGNSYIFCETEGRRLLAGLATAPEIAADEINRENDDDGVIRKRIYDRVVTIWWAKVRAWAFEGAATTLGLFGLGAVKPGLPEAIQKAISLWNGNGYAGAVAAQIDACELQLEQELLRNPPCHRATG
jgi:hypothetical protein